MKLLVALDMSERAPQVLDAAVKLAEGMDALLVLESVVPPLATANEYSVAPPSVFEMILDSANQGMKKLAQRVPEQRLGGTYVEIGVPWQTILLAAQREKASMIVMGAHGYNLVERMLGTTAGRVVNHADRTVVVVRSPPAADGKVATHVAW